MLLQLLLPIIFEPPASTSSKKMGACFSKCGGKSFNKKDGGGSMKAGDTPQLVNKVEHKQSFSESPLTNIKKNGAATNGTNGTARKHSVSSSISSEDKVIN